MVITRNLTGSKTAFQTSVFSIPSALLNLCDLVCVLRTMSYLLMWFCSPRLLLLPYMTSTSPLPDWPNSILHMTPDLFSKLQLSSSYGVFIWCPDCYSIDPYWYLLPLYVFGWINFLPFLPFCLLFFPCLVFEFYPHLLTLKLEYKVIGFIIRSSYICTLYFALIFIPPHCHFQSSTIPSLFTFFL